MNIKETGMSSAEFSDFMLNEAGVASCPGVYFGEAGEGFVRFSYATSLPEIEEAIERMSAALEKRGASQ